MSGQMGAYALGYGERGIPVFPCSGKVPLTEHGFKDATTDPIRIRAMWEEHPDANIGGAMGDGLRTRALRWLGFPLIDRNRR